ncbi:unnamed protein product [Camellia sinensis]
MEQKDLMKQVYAGASAKRKNVQILGESGKPMEVDEGTGDTDDIIGLTPFTSNAPVTPSEGFSTTAKQLKEDEDCAWKRNGKAKDHQKRRKGVGASTPVDIVDNLVQAIMSQSREVTIIHRVYGNGNPNATVKDCFPKLMNLPGLLPTDVPLFCFALTLLDNPHFREVLMGLPSDERCLKWLQTVKQQYRGGGSAR